MTHANWYVAAYIAAASGSTGPAGSATDEKPPGVEVSLRTVASQPSPVPLTSFDAKHIGTHNVLISDPLIVKRINFLVKAAIFLPDYYPLIISVAKFH